MQNQEYQPRIKINLPVTTQGFAEKLTVLRLYQAGVTPKEISMKFPDQKPETIRMWCSRYTTDVTKETTTETVVTQRSITTSSETIADTFVNDTNLSQQKDDVNADLNVNDSVTIDNQEALIVENTKWSVFDAIQEFGVKHLISIVLLSVTVLTLKWFSVSEVEVVINQITKARGSNSLLAFVIVFGSFVFLICSRSTTTMLSISIVIVTLLVQVFCTGVSAVQSVAIHGSEINKAITTYTFFSPNGFAWTWAFTKGGLDFFMEYVLITIIQDGKEQY